MQNIKLLKRRKDMQLGVRSEDKLAKKQHTITK